MELSNHCRQPAEIKKLEHFLQALGRGESIEIRSSGSTGPPKVLIFSHQELQRSAKMTIARFGLTHMDILLCPFSLDYVAGKMMVARSYYSGARLLFTGPHRSPYLVIENQQPTFAALVPMQLGHTLKSTEATRRLNQTKNVLIGGAPLPASLEKEILEKVTCPVFQTFGMTETLSHFALRKLTHDNTPGPYLPLPGVSLDSTADGRLRVRTPLRQEWLETNDVICMEGDGFLWKGRSDWTINSGGHKLHPELLEEKLTGFFGNRTVVAVGKKHPLLGQALHLMVAEPFSKEGFVSWARQHLHPYELPKSWSMVGQFPLLANGKLDRMEMMRIIEENKVESHPFKQ